MGWSTLSWVANQDFKTGELSHQHSSVLHLAVPGVHFMCKCTASVRAVALLQGNSTLDGMHAALQSLYDKQVLMAGKTPAGFQVSAILVTACVLSQSPVQSVKLAAIVT